MPHIPQRNAVPHSWSFQVTNTHMESLDKTKLISFIIAFMEDIDKEVSEMKLGVNSRGRVVATKFLEQFS